MITVQVTKAAKVTYWYANRMGDEFTVIGTNVFDGELHFKVTRQKETSGTPYISVKDCRVFIGGCEFKDIGTNESAQGDSPEAV